MRRFNFYERESVRAPALQVLDVTCTASGRGSLVIGDSEGHVVLVDRNFRTQAFQAHRTRVNALFQLKNSPVLVSIGDGADCRPPHIRAAARSAVLAARDRASRDVEAEKGASRKSSVSALDEEGNDTGTESDLGLALGLGVPLEGVASALSRGDALWDAGAVLTSAAGAVTGEDTAATLKVWRLDQRDPRTGQPECVRTSRVFLGSAKDPVSRERLVTCMSVSEDLTQAAVGCGDGALLLLRGDLMKGDRTGRQGRSGRLAVSFSLGLGSSSTALKPQLIVDPGEAAANGAITGGEDGVAGLNAQAVTCLAYATHADQAGGDADASRKPFGPAGGNAPRRARPMVCLFACTPAAVRCFFPTEIRPTGMGRGWGPGESFLELGTPGAAPGCAILGDAGEYVVGNDSGVFFYSPEERKGAYVLPGKKQRLAWFRGCLIAATEEAAGSGPASGTSNARRGDGLPAAGGGPVTLTVYDLRSKFVAYTMSLGVGVGATAALVGGKVGGSQTAPSVRFIMPEWGQLFVLVSAPPGADGALAVPTLASGAACGGPVAAIQLSEKDTSSKVDTLCRLHLFDMALTVAGAANYGRDALADISRAHGDHLYSRGDFDGAVAQYCRTIGHVEPSYVIRRFLDSARVGNLAVYLETLHGAGAAGSDHTTLLLNCYTKMGAQDKLRAFIRGGHAGKTDGQKPAATSEPTFDVRVAIAVLRDAGCCEEATWLAEAHEEHDLYLALLLLPGGARVGADVHVPALPSPSPAGASAALTFLRRLPFLDAEYYARKYGRLLLAAIPGQATDFLVSLASKWQRVKPYVQGSAERPGGLVTLASLGLGDESTGAAAAMRERSRCEDVSTLLPLFADHPRELKRFLEAVTAKASGGEAAAPGSAVWHALLEVSLRRDVYTHQGEGGTEGTALQDGELARAQDECVLVGVLRNPAAVYDPATALVLCQAAGHRPGCLVLFERMGMRPLVLAQYMEQAEGARHAGKHAESKAARRELLRRVKAMTEPGAADAVGPSSSSSTALATLQGDAGSVEAAGLWISVLRYLSRSYLDPTGATVLPAAGSAAGLEPGLPLLGEEDSTVRVTYPGLTGAVLTREREEQDAVLSDALKHLEKATATGGHLAGALPALTVLSVLSECPHLPFGLVRDFLMRRLGGEATVADEERRILAGLRADTDALQAEVHRLDTQPVVFQSRSCRLCGLELDLPSVHFLCGGGPRLSETDKEGDGDEERKASAQVVEEHTFHLHCVTEALSSNLGLGQQSSSGDSDLQCPVCAGEQATVRAIVAGLGPKAGLAEQFYTSLAAAPDGFLKAAEYLGKGLFLPS